MAVLKPKIALVQYATGASWVQPLEKSLNNLSLPFERIQQNDGTGKMTVEYLSSFNIIFMMMSNQTPNANTLSIIPQLFNMGVNIIELTINGAQSTVDNSFAMRFGSCTSATWVNVNTPVTNKLNDDSYNIAKNAGLTPNDVYTFNNSSSTFTGMRFDTPYTGVNTLYYFGTILTAPAAIHMPKGIASATIPETKAHFVAFGNLYNPHSTGATLSYSSDFDKYLESIISVMTDKYIIKGIVKDTANNPIVRDVYVYMRSTGVYLGTVKSASDGKFQFKLPFDDFVYVVAKADDSDTKPTVVYDKIKPVLNLT